jgi:hypothetical protein
MYQKAYDFLKNLLGQDFLETLEKTELYKPGTRTTVDPEEIRIAMKVVPKAIMALLVKELIPMSIGEYKEFSIFVGNNAILKANKTEKDCYNGEIIENNKKVAEFYSRTLPGVGLYLLSTFELYDMYSKEPEKEEDLDSKIHKMIEERLLLRDLIAQVVDKKLMEKEAIEKLLAHKLTHIMSEKKETEIPTPLMLAENTAAPTTSTVVPAPYKSNDTKTYSGAKKIKGSPVVDFIRNRKPKNVDFFIEMQKNETVSCPDCRKEIFNETGFSGCICLGDNRDSKINIVKSENGIRVSFGKKWELENIEMLLEVLRGKNE